MTRRSATAVFAVVLFFAGLVIPSGSAQQLSKPVKAIQLTGLKGVKDNAKGTLSVESGHLHFVHGKASSDVNATSIQDVVTGADTQKAVGKTIGTLSMAAPYGGGRLLGLFRSKIDTLTLQYRDAEGGLHGAIFTIPVGTAELIKKELVAQGAHTISDQGSAAASATPTNPSTKEQEQ